MQTFTTAGAASWVVSMAGKITRKDRASLRSSTVEASELVKATKKNLLTCD